MINWASTVFYKMFQILSKYFGCHPHGWITCSVTFLRGLIQHRSLRKWTCGKIKYCGMAFPTAFIEQQSHESSTLSRPHLTHLFHSFPRSDFGGFVDGDNATFIEIINIACVKIVALKNRLQIEIKITYIFLLKLVDLARRVGSGLQIERLVCRCREVRSHLRLAVWFWIN